MNYINAHATSTLVGDIAEVKAVRSVFSDWSNIKMNATKSMIGHCLGAAAGVEAIATIMAIKRGEVHPTINHQVRYCRLSFCEWRDHVLTVWEHDVFCKCTISFNRQTWCRLRLMRFPGSTLLPMRSRSWRSLLRYRTRLDLVATTLHVSLLLLRSDSRAIILPMRLLQEHDGACTVGRLCKHAYCVVLCLATAHC